VIVGNLRDAAHEQAESDGFEVVPIEQASERAQVVILLVPDEVMPAVYRERVEPRLAKGDMVAFASATPCADSPNAHPSLVGRFCY
jgi:ketol-acid reductoisomerase